MYLAVTEYAILEALVREEDKVQWAVYYISKRLVDAETMYPKMKKLALALVIAMRKLRPYFHSHPVWVFTNYPLRQVRQKLDALGRLLKWAIKLSQFEIEFQPRPVLKGQALTDFIAEFSHKPDERPEEGSSPSMPQVPKWVLYVNGASNDGGSRVGLILISPEGHRIHCALRFGF